MPSYSVVIPWRSRPELRETLTANARYFKRHNAEVVVINCGGPEEDIAAVIPERAPDLLRFVTLPGVAFNRSLAMNTGAYHSRGDALLFLDADIVLKSDLIAQASRMLCRDRCVVSVRTVHDSIPSDPGIGRVMKRVVETRTVTLHDDRRARLTFYKGADGARGGTGLMLVRRDDFLAVGGFNSGLTGWGFEDIDLLLRLQFVLSVRARSTGRVLHLTHGDEVRDLKFETTAQNLEHNMMACFANYGAANYMGTYAHDVRGAEP